MDCPLLRTERLELFRPQIGDLPGLVAMVAPEDTRRFLGPARADPADQFARLLRNAGSWSLYGYGTFAVRRRDDVRLIGSCGIFHSWRGFGSGMDDVPEAGWIIDKEHWGQGLAAEAMHAVLDWFDATHGPRRVTCMIEEGHEVSHRLARRLGFEVYGQHQPADGSDALVLYERLPA
jgi:RimJ/RimL family protein N-acetyltransferase